MRQAGLLLLLGTAAWAGPERLYVTELGRRVLARTDLAVEAGIVRIQPAFRGVMTAHLEVRERFTGFDRARHLVLMYVEDYLAPGALGSTFESTSLRYDRARRAGVARSLDEAAQGAAPRVERSREKAGAPESEERGIRLAKGDEGLFFLRRKGATYALYGFVPRRDPLYEAKRERLREVVRIEAIPGLEERARYAKRFYLKGIESPDAWERGNSARELRSLARRFPGIFTKEEVVRLARRLFDEPDRIIQSELERAVRALDAEQAEAYAVAAEAEEQERAAEALAQERRRLEGVKSPEMRAADLANLARRYRRAATGLLVEFLQDPDALVRETVAQALAEYGGPSCRPALRTRLDQETNREVAGALVYACGGMSDPEAVEGIARRLKDPRLERTAVHALARIGTPAARAALLRHRGRAAPETARLIDRLLEEEFGEDS